MQENEQEREYIFLYVFGETYVSSCSTMRKLGSVLIAMRSVRGAIALFHWLHLSLIL